MPDWRSVGTFISKFLLYLFSALAGVALVAAALGTAALVFLWGARISTGGAPLDLPSVLLTTASLFILIFSVLVGLAAIFGWRGLQDLTAHRVQERVEEEIEKIRLDSSLSVGTTRALIYAKMSYEKYLPAAQMYRGREVTILVKNGEFLNSAINTLEKAYEMAPDDHEKLGLIENNLAFLLAVREEAKDADRALELVESLRARHKKWDDPAVMNTCARVVAAYSGELAKDGSRPKLSVNG